jgi:preprotein translocase subunit SecD
MRRWVVGLNIVLTLGSVLVLVQKGGLNLGLDLKGGVHLVYEIDTSQIQGNITPLEAQDRTVEVIRNRVDPQGVGEVLIQRQGEKWIIVQFPGSQDPAWAKKMVGTTARLEFKLVDEQANANEPEKIPDTSEILPMKKNQEKIVVRKDALLTGAFLSNAYMNPSGAGDFGNQPFVSLEFNPEGAKIFGQITQANVGKRLAIVLDGVVHSAPNIRTAIMDGKAIIEGGFSIQEAGDLALVLRAGALPVPVNLLSENVIGPTLGRDSVEKGTMAAVGAGLLVFVFMAFYYRMSGVIANVGMAMNVLFMMALLAMLDATLTLPGIAGIALTMGMSVDSNVLIFERIREEMLAGRTIRTAVDAGFRHAWVAIFDSHVTTLITAVALFLFGTGPVKGFAVSLSVGVTISLYTAWVITKEIFQFRVNRPGVTELSI